MAVNAITPTASTDLTQATQSTSDLGKNDFLNLLVTQLKNQDPLDPVKNQDFIAQLAQFNSLEQMMNLNKSFTTMLNLSSLAQASSLIGKQIGWYDANGQQQVGQVTSVTVENQVPMLQVGTTSVSLSDVMAIGQ